MSALDWNITSEQLETELGKVLLLDVRQPEEHAESRIEGCTLIPLGELQARATAALPDPNADIVVYCAHGVRSLQGVMILRMLGYGNTRSLHGGICAWEEYQAQKK
jgi:rhodanese-related sulfurtransferase